jgi:homoserine kinase
LFRYAAAGESASGSIHGDNIAASLFGGLTLYLEKENTFVVENIPVPESLYCVLAHPDFILETKKAREILKKEVELKQHIRQSMYLSAFLAGCFKNDLSLLKGSVQDIIIEPQRAHLIPSFSQMKEAALKAGSIGFSISGAGPAVFALCDSKASALAVEEALSRVTQNLPYKVRIWNTRLDEEGARIIRS